MKLHEVALPRRDEDLNDNHITAATYMAPMRALFPEAHFSTGGLPRNTKAGKTVVISVEVPLPVMPDVNIALNIIERHVRGMPNVVGYKVIRGLNTGTFTIQVTTALDGIQKERMDFINDVRARIKKLNPRMIQCSAENHKDGAYVKLTTDVWRLITVLGDFTNPDVKKKRDAILNQAIEQIDEFVDELVETYGDRMGINPGEVSTTVSYH